MSVGIGLVHRTLRVTGPGVSLAITNQREPAPVHAIVIAVAMSWLGRLNYYVLQWMFIRLAKVVEDDGTFVRWTVLWGIIPTTGWSSDYRYVWKRSR